jgi:predicted amidohydrolase
MPELNVALLQLTACRDDQAANQAKGEAYCREARRMGADIALFPELWNVGYTFDRHAGEGAPDSRPEAEGSGDLWRAPELWRPEDAAKEFYPREVIRRFHEQAIGRDDAFVTGFRNLARELDMAIALTYLERWDGPPRNTVSLIDRHGEIVLTYAKVHTCDFDLPEATLTPGDGFHVCTLDTAAGDVKVGAMICYDREFPESARVLMLQGAEIILTPNASHLQRHHLIQFQVRALENMVGVAMANYARPQGGRSCAFDGIGFDEKGSRDMTVIQAGESEGVYLARFDLDRLRAHRTAETYGNAFRRPHCYGLLTSQRVEPPFLRVDSRGEPYHPRS